jgi:putative methyltransferase (TIGR04325 family)
MYNISININKLKYFYKLAYIKFLYFFFSKNIIKSYTDQKLNISIYNKTLKFKNLINKNFKIKKNLNYNRTLKLAFFLKKKKLKQVIDFGGGAGYHFYIVKKKLDISNLKWHIVENKTMVNLCNNYRINYNNSGLFFNDDLKKINKADIFFSSCSINYTQNPIKVYNQISKMDVKYLYFTRTPLTKNKSLRFNQTSFLSENGPLPDKIKYDDIVQYTNTVINLSLFEKIFLKNFKLITKYIDEKNAFKFKNLKIDTYTYLLKKNI